ncbi:MAG TPA: hypothetical protein VIH35_00910, partial [Kiritimatiellia bacterium]
MGHFRRVFYWLRVTLLVAVFAGAYVLYRWSQKQDPRFFTFLASGPGRVLARLFNWQGMPMEQVVPEKAADELTPDEVAVKAKLEAAMAALVPTHRIELTDGQVMTGFVVSDTPQTLVFRQSYGDSASIESSYPRSRVRKIEPNPVRIPPVTYRDIRFKMEFPDQQFYKMKPYSFLTDESYLRIVHAVNELQLVYKQFRDSFAPLIDQGRLRDDLQVLFFNDEQRFRAYQRQLAPGLDYTVGFYAPSLDRLVVFNQAQGEDIRALQQEVDDREATYRQQARGQDDQRRVEEWKKK